MVKQRPYNRSVMAPGSNSGESVRRMRSRRREEVLDSSSDEDSSVGGGSMQNTPSRSSSVSQQYSISSSSSTAIGSNLSSSLFKRAERALTGDGLRGVGGEGEARRREMEQESASDYEEEDDEELMNPYIMNPFNRNNSDANNSQLVLNSAALLPPSLELASITRRNTNDDEQRSHDKSPERLLQPQLTQQSQQQQKIQHGEAFKSPPRTTRKKNGALANFDPYSPKAVRVQQRVDTNTNEPCYELEMEEEEEAIEFISPDRGQSKNQQQNDGLNVFGPLLDDPHAQHVSQQESFSSSTFSPFPKHRSRQDYSPGTSGEYGEGSPLSSSSFAARHGRGPNSPRAAGGIMGILGAIVNVFKAILSSVAYGASSLLYGNQATPNRQGNINPFSTKRRLNVRMSNQSNHWGMLSYFRLFAIAMAGLFCVGTVTVMWNVPSGNDVGSNTISKKVYQSSGKVVSQSGAQDGQVQHRPSSIVLKKMEKAKRHWWNKKKAESTDGSQPHTEVYRAGLQESLEVEQLQQVAEGNNSARETLPVIVSTEEDGTVLIKLPPPKMNLQEPRPMGSTQDQALPEPPMGNTGDDETLYIKLPYPQQQSQQQQRQLTEIEPPLRGAAIPQPQAPHDSPLKRRPPGPMEQSHSSTKHQNGNSNHNHRRVGGFHAHEIEPHGVIGELRNEFNSWINKHGKSYGSHEEKEHRFNVWRNNHVRLKEKNQKHGPCRMTGKAVFGHNLFSDLAPEEFQSKFLTGYRGPRGGHGQHKNDNEQKDKHSHSYFRETRRNTKSNERDPPPAASVKRHPNIQRKLEEHTAMYGGSGTGDGSSHTRLHGAKYQSKYLNGCSWWDVSCLLRWVFGYQYVGGTREPVYDASSYPSALDWRAMGVVSSVHSQGSCGACWAITAVETIESANAIFTGDLIDLDEEEVIACDGTCEMCNGGWPQNAYEYVMEHEGLPLSNADYDADWLYTVTAVLAGESYEASEYEMGSYFAMTCPAGKRSGEGGGSGSGSQKSGDGDYGYEYESSYVEVARYGHVKGYGYATDRCVCYTDGSGCDCDDQDEQTAVLNVASYGPAAVCLEASMWQDYEGGIMTSDIGCSKSFLDMNHCVEVVGYAFTDGNSNGNGEEGSNDNSGSGSNDNHSGSGDGQREGYWIVKNQWSNYWGMNGYAYVAMGENTCGILNDMTQVYME